MTRGVITQCCKDCKFLNGHSLLVHAECTRYPPVFNRPGRPAEFPTINDPLNTLCGEFKVPAKKATGRKTKKMTALSRYLDIVISRREAFKYYRSRGKGGPRIERWAYKDVRRTIDMYEAGEDIAAISKAIGRSEKAINHKLREYGAYKLDRKSPTR